MIPITKAQSRIILKRLYSVFYELFMFGISCYIGLKYALVDFTSNTFAIYFTIIYFLMNLAIFLKTKDKIVGDILPRIKLIPLRTKFYYSNNIFRIMFHSLLYYIFFNYELSTELLMLFISNVILGALFFTNPTENIIITFTDKIFGSYYVEDKLIPNSTENN